MATTRPSGEFEKALKEYFVLEQKARNLLSSGQGIPDELLDKLAAQAERLREAKDLPIGPVPDIEAIIKWARWYKANRKMFESFSSMGFSAPSPRTFEFTPRLLRCARP